MGHLFICQHCQHFGGQEINRVEIFFLCKWSDEQNFNLKCYNKREGLLSNIEA